MAAGIEELSRFEPVGISYRSSPFVRRRLSPSLKPRQTVDGSDKADTGTLDDTDRENAEQEARQQERQAQEAAREAAASRRSRGGARYRVTNLDEIGESIADLGEGEQADAVRAAYEELVESGGTDSAAGTRFNDAMNAYNTHSRETWRTATGEWVEGLEDGEHTTPVQAAWAELADSGFEDEDARTRFNEAVEAHNTHSRETWNKSTGAYIEGLDDSPEASELRTTYEAMQDGVDPGEQEAFDQALTAHNEKNRAEWNKSTGAYIEGLDDSPEASELRTTYEAMQDGVDPGEQEAFDQALTAHNEKNRAEWNKSTGAYIEGLDDSPEASELRTTYEAMQDGVDPGEQEAFDQALTAHNEKNRAEWNKSTGAYIEGLDDSPEASELRTTYEAMQDGVDPGEQEAFDQALTAHNEKNRAEWNKSTGAYIEGLDDSPEASELRTTYEAMQDGVDPGEQEAFDQALTAHNEKNRAEWNKSTGAYIEGLDDSPEASELRTTYEAMQDGVDPGEQEAFDQALTAHNEKNRAEWNKSTGAYIEGLDDSPEASELRTTYEAMQDGVDPGEQEAFDQALTAHNEKNRADWNTSTGEYIKGLDDSPEAQRLKTTYEAMQDGVDPGEQEAFDQALTAHNDKNRADWNKSTGAYVEGLDDSPEASELRTTYEAMQDGVDPGEQEAFDQALTAHNDKNRADWNTSTGEYIKGLDDSPEAQRLKTTYEAMQDGVDPGEQEAFDQALTAHNDKNRADWNTSTGEYIKGLDDSPEAQRLKTTYEAMQDGVDPGEQEAFDQALTAHNDKNRADWNTSTGEYIKGLDDSPEAQRLKTTYEAMQDGVDPGEQEAFDQALTAHNDKNRAEWNKSTGAYVEGLDDSPEASELRTTYEAMQDGVDPGEQEAFDQALTAHNDKNRADWNTSTGEYIEGLDDSPEAVQLRTTYEAMQDGVDPGEQEAFDQALTAHNEKNRVAQYDMDGDGKLDPWESAVATLGPRPSGGAALIAWEARLTELRAEDRATPEGKARMIEHIREQGNWERAGFSSPESYYAHFTSQSYLDSYQSPEDSVMTPAELAEAHANIDSGVYGRNVYAPPPDAGPEPSGADPEVRPVKASTAPVYTSKQEIAQAQQGLIDRYMSGEINQAELQNLIDSHRQGVEQYHATNPALATNLGDARSAAMQATAAQHEAAQKAQEAYMAALASFLPAHLTAEEKRQALLDLTPGDTPIENATSRVQFEFDKDIGGRATFSTTGSRADFFRQLFESEVKNVTAATDALTTYIADQGGEISGEARNRYEELVSARDQAIYQASRRLGAPPQSNQTREEALTEHVNRINQSVRDSGTTEAYEQYEAATAAANLLRTHLDTFPDPEPATSTETVETAPAVTQGQRPSLFERIREAAAEGRANVIAGAAAGGAGAPTTPPDQRVDVTGAMDLIGASDTQTPTYTAPDLGNEPQGLSADDLGGGPVRAPIGASYGDDLAAVESPPAAAGGEIGLETEEFNTSPQPLHVPRLGDMESEAFHQQPLAQPDLAEGPAGSTIPALGGDQPLTGQTMATPEVASVAPPPPAAEPSEREGGVGSFFGGVLVGQAERVQRPQITAEGAYEVHDYFTGAESDQPATVRAFEDTQVQLLPGRTAADRARAAAFAEAQPRRGEIGLSILPGDTPLSAASGQRVAFSGLEVGSTGRISEEFADREGLRLSPLSAVPLQETQRTLEASGGQPLTKGQYANIALDVATIAPIPAAGSLRVLRGAAGTLVDTAGNVISAGSRDFKIQKLHGILSDAPPEGGRSMVQRVADLEASGVGTLQAYEQVAKARGHLPADYGSLATSKARPEPYGGGDIYAEPGSGMAPGALPGGRIGPEGYAYTRTGLEGQIPELAPTAPQLTQQFGRTYSNPYIATDTATPAGELPTGGLGPAHLRDNPLASPTYEVAPRAFREAEGTLGPTAQRIRQPHEPPLGDTTPGIVPDTYALRMGERLDLPPSGGTGLATDAPTAMSPALSPAATGSAPLSGSGLRPSAAQPVASTAAQPMVRTPSGLLVPASAVSPDLFVAQQQLQGQSALLGTPLTVGQQATGQPEVSVGPTARRAFQTTELPAAEPTTATEFQTTELPAVQPTAATEFQTTELPAVQPTAATEFQTTELPAVQPTAATEFQTTELPAVQPTAATEFQTTELPAVQPTAATEFQTTELPAVQPTAATEFQTTELPAVQPTAATEFQTTELPAVQPTAATEFQTTELPAVQPFGLDPMPRTETITRTDLDQFRLEDLRRAQGLQPGEDLSSRPAEQTGQDAEPVPEITHGLRTIPAGEKAVHPEIAQGLRGDDEQPPRDPANPLLGGAEEGARPQDEFRGRVRAPQLAGSPDSDREQVAVEGPPDGYARRVRHTERVEYSYDPETDQFSASLVDSSDPVIVARDASPPQVVERQVGAYNVAPEGRDIRADVGEADIDVPPAIQAKLRRLADEHGGPASLTENWTYEHDIDTQTTDRRMQSTRGARERAGAIAGGLRAGASGAFARGQALARGAAAGAVERVGTTVEQFDQGREAVQAETQDYQQRVSTAQQEVGDAAAQLDRARQEAGRGAVIQHRAARIRGNQDPDSPLTQAEERLAAAQDQLAQEQADRPRSSGSAAERAGRLAPGIAAGAGQFGTRAMSLAKQLQKLQAAQKPAKGGNKRRSSSSSKTKERKPTYTAPTVIVIREGGGSSAGGGRRGRYGGL